MLANTTPSTTSEVSIFIYAIFVCMGIFITKGKAAEMLIIIKKQNLL